MGSVTGHCDSVRYPLVSARDELERGDRPTHRFSDPGGFNPCHKFEIHIDKGKFAAVTDQQALGLFSWLIPKDHELGPLAG